MSDTTPAHDDLTSTQEYAIAGFVILFFGLLYWLFNYGMPDFGSRLVAVPAPVVLEADNTHTATTAAAPERIALSDVAADGTVATPNNAVQSQAVVMPKADNAAARTVAEVAPATATQASVVAAGTQPATAAESESESTEVMANGQQQALVTDQAAVVTDNAQATVAEQQAGSVTADTASVVIMDAAVSKLQDYLVTGEMEKPVVMESVNFAAGSSEIELESDHQIVAIAGLLQKYPDTKLLIRGHADADSASENKELSLLRARAMGRKLVEAGAKVESIIIMGMGSAEPLSGGKNRRVDVSITQ